MADDRDVRSLSVLCSEALDHKGPDRLERLKQALYLAEECHEEWNYDSRVDRFITTLENTIIHEFGPGSTL